MLRAIIIDDEINIRKIIRKKINLFFETQIKIIAEAGSVKEGTQIINNYQPNLLFLDIELSDGSSFELLKKIEFTDYKIIFITGFNEHAIKAIRIGALDYILKPIDDDEFINATNKAIANLDKRKDVTQFIKVSSDFFNNSENKRIVLKTLDTHYIVNEKDIIYCKSEGMYTTFFMQNNEQVLISKSLKKANELLSTTTFIRCHQSFIVNKNYVDKYLTEGYLVVNNIKIPIASRRKELVIKKLTDK